MDAETAVVINEHLGLAFDHLREAIMVAIAGEPTQEVGGAMGRLQRFVESGGDTSILMEGLPEDAQQFMADATLLFPEPGESDVPVDEPNKQEEFTEEEVEELAAEIEDEEDEFAGLFDDIDEDDDSDDGPADAPAAF